MGEAKMVNVINKGGAVHTVALEAYKEYINKHQFRKLKAAEQKKLAELSGEVARLSGIRLNAVDEHGQPDYKARQEAARKVPEAKKKEVEYRLELSEDLRE